MAFQGVWVYQEPVTARKDVASPVGRQGLSNLSSQAIMIMSAKASRSLAHFDVNRSDSHSALLAMGTPEGNPVWKNTAQGVAADLMQRPCRAWVPSLLRLVLTVNF